MEMRNKVFDAADKLDAQGKKVTYLSIKDEIGGGSFSTIGQFIQEWKKNKNVSKLLPTPEELTYRMNSFLSELWNQAGQIADNRFVGERMELMDQIKDLTESLEEVSSRSAKAIAERDAAVEKMNSLEASFATAKEELEAERKRAAELDIRYQESNQVNEMKLIISTLKRQNKELNEKLGGGAAPKTAKSSYANIKPNVKKQLRAKTHERK